MLLPHINFGGFNISSLGLGCSRLGSIMGSSVGEAENLVAKALDFDITYFDTASSYGQGDSERILGRIIGKNDKICLVTKIGKKVPFRAMLLKPIKGLVRDLARWSGGAGTVIKKSRAGSLPVMFDIPFLERELLKSRQRLNLDCIPMVMLHSPSETVLLEGEAVGVLERAQERGDIRIVGVAVDDLAAAEAALCDARIKAIQVPYYEGDVAMINWVERAQQSGKLVIAREIFQGIPAVSPADVHAHLRHNLKRVLSTDGIGVSLVGTTKTAHLSEVIDIAQSLIRGENNC